MNRLSSRTTTFFGSLVRRICIVGGYIGIFVFIVYLPTLLEFLYQKKSINVLVFAETFSPDTLVRFEQDTGIKVNVTYAEIDDQIFAKFKMDGGAGYDVVNISDFLVYSLSCEDKLHELHHGALPNFSKIDPRLLQLVYDPDNKYSIPHKWYVYGLAYDKEAFTEKQDLMSLRYVFQDPKTVPGFSDNQKIYKVCMLDDARDAVFLAAIYLFGKVDNLSSDEFKQIESLLIDQKRWVEVYTVHSAQYFLYSDITPIALMSSNYMQKIFENSDRFAFAIPREGSMLIVENFAIPKKSQKLDLAQQFINYMIDDEIAYANSAHYKYNSANSYALAQAYKSDKAYESIFPKGALFDRLYIPLLAPDVRKIVEDLWIAVGLA